MKDKLKYIILGHLVLIFFSCKHLKWTRIDGKLKKTDNFWRYPRLSTSYTKRGVKIVKDTVDNYIVSKTRYKESVGCWHFEIIRLKTITYNKRHKKIKKYIVRRGKRKTIEYFKNDDNPPIKAIDDALLSDTTKAK